MPFVFDVPPSPALRVAGTERLFPIRRVFCVGRNYAEHAREMGALDQAEGQEPPFFFMKPADAVVTSADEIAVAYPPQTENLHHEVELIVALAHGGANVAVDDALGLVFGYTVGIDLTRRDIQAKAKAKGHPWDMAKGFDQSAVAGVLMPVAQVGHPCSGRIWLSINGEIKQSGDLTEMGWKVADIIANLSCSVALAAGDIIYTGTPAGVGALQRGDAIEAGVDGVARLSARIV